MVVRRVWASVPRRGVGFRALGMLMLLLGIGSLALGPLEMVCFTWFEEGGRFAYEGFGFGSFMFGTMAMQILGYYLIAAILIPLGYGHLRLRRWVRIVMPALVWCWVALGVPLLIVVLFILLATKELTAVAAGGSALLAVLSYVALPGLVLQLYRSRRARAAFAAAAPQPHLLFSRIEAIGVPGLAVIALECFFTVALHVLLFFNGLFPTLTGWVTGLPGYVRVDVAILLLLVILWGTLQRHRWAWWASLAYFTGMVVLWCGTLISTRWYTLLAVLAFPPYEVALLDGFPLQGWHLAVLVGLPLAGTLVAIGCAYRDLTFSESGLQ